MLVTKIILLFVILFVWTGAILNLLNGNKTSDYQAITWLALAMSALETAFITLQWLL